MRPIACALGVALGLAWAGTASAGITIFQESFEGEPGTGYTLSDSFDDGSFDFFGRYLVPDIDNAARDEFEFGWDGSYGILGQDHDGDGAAATQVVTLAGIDISGFSGLSTVMSFGALNSEPNFFNYEADDNDGFRIYATIDGGVRTLIGAFLPGVDGAGDLLEDTDLDGIGDGTGLTVDLADFSFALPSDGAILDLEIEMTSTSSFEPLALDNVRVVPAPGALALLALGGLAGRRRRG